MNTYVTTHSCERMKERVGLPKRAHCRMAKIALNRGLNPEFTTGDFRDWLEKKARQHIVEIDSIGNVVLRIHAYELYIFRHLEEQSGDEFELLITVVRIPKVFWKMVDSARLRSESPKETGT